MNIAPKTAAATAGGSLSVSVVALLEWILSYWHIEMTPTVAASLATIFAVVFSYFAPKQQPTAEELKNHRVYEFGPTPTDALPEAGGQQERQYHIP